MAFKLSVEQGPQQFICRHVVRVVELVVSRSHGLVGELQEAPLVRSVHVYFASGCPHPVFLWSAFLQPFHTREIKPPRVSCLQWVCEVARYGLVWYGHLHCPRAVAVVLLVERAVTLHGKFHARAIPLHVEVAIRAISTVKHQVEHHATRVVLNLKIALSVACWVEKHLKVVVVIYYGVALRQVGHYVRLLQHCRHI